MEKIKAYKLLALQEGISNSKAKDLIDKGLVTLEGRKVVIARAEVSPELTFKVKKLEKIEVIFEDEDILAVSKPAFLDSSEVERVFKDAILLNRLDKQTSGVMLLAKNEEFRLKAIEEYRSNRVYKEYLAIVEGKVIDELVIDKPISTSKQNNKAYSKIDFKKGKSAKTTVFPMLIEGRKSKIRLVIENGRTHQIRVHLKSANLPVIGDELYGKSSQTVARMLLHSHITRILSYEFIAKEPKDFRVFGF